MNKPFSWARTHDNGYEVSSRGDCRFSALFAKLPDGRTIEEAYQLDVKGYRSLGNSWRIGKGKQPLVQGLNLWNEYLSLWLTWADANSQLIADLYIKANGRVLTDCFARTHVNQAHALCVILNDWDQL